MSLTKDGYLNRLHDTDFNRYLEAFGAVCIEGPKGCGKTWFALNNCNSAFFLADPSNNFGNRKLAAIDVKAAFSGKRPHLIDEWQENPEIWDATKMMVDESRDMGQFVLTGSSTPIRKGIMHSGAGRIGVLKLRTMSLFESGDSSGEVSLKDLFEGKMETVITGEVRLEDLIYYTVRGGWPRLIGSSVSSASLSVKGYLDMIIKDASSMDGIDRDESKIAMVIRSLARNESTLAKVSRISADITESINDGSTEFKKKLSVSEKTISEYLNIFDRLFLIENQTAYSPNLKSELRVGKMPKRHLTDPSLSVAALGLTADKLLKDPDLFGLYFEALCERDLSIYAEVLGGKLYHYRELSGREIDAILELPDGRLGAFEIKLGTKEIDRAAEELIRTKDNWTKKGAENVPEVLCVISGMTSAAYRRPDGVFVVPITALRP